MAIVIDENCANIITKYHIFPILLNWLRTRGTIGSSRELRNKLHKINEYRQHILTPMDDAGRHIKLTDEMESTIDSTIDSIKNQCKCDTDHFIIAMMKLGGFRLIVSNDTKLIDDIGNREILNNPRGKCYCQRTGDEGIGSAPVRELDQRSAMRLLTEYGKCGDSS